MTNFKVFSHFPISEISFEATHATMVKLQGVVLVLASVLCSFSLGIFIARLPDPSHVPIAPSTHTGKCEKKFSSKFLTQPVPPPAICIIGRSSAAHLPTALSAFSFSLLSTNYPVLLQFIVGCEFNEPQDTALRETVDRINCAENSTLVFVVNRNQTARSKYLIEKINDFCYIETDLVVDRLLIARTGDLRDGRLAWPALEERLLPRAAETPMCDYFMFTNTDNLYASRTFHELGKHINQKVVCALFVYTYPPPPLFLHVRMRMHAHFACAACV